MNSFILYQNNLRVNLYNVFYTYKLSSGYIFYQDPATFIFCPFTSILFKEQGNRSRERKHRVWCKSVEFFHSSTLKHFTSIKIPTIALQITLGTVRSCSPIQVKSQQIL